MNYESGEHYDAEIGYSAQAEAEVLSQSELSKVDWEEKFYEPDMFVIKKTQDSEGYVCYNYGRLKYTQVFSHNPQDALQRYMEKLIELTCTS